MTNSPLPLLGFSAYSGTGKTTLLTLLLPLLKAKGLRVGVIKHTHHNMAIDKPGKDSHRFRESGASQVLLASRKRIAWIEERDSEKSEPELKEVISALNPSTLDLVLVEGFKQDRFPKIELRRSDLARPFLYPNDDNIVAIASDKPLDNPPAHLHQLNINNPEQISQFVIDHILGWHDKPKMARVNFR